MIFLVPGMIGAALNEKGIIQIPLTAGQEIDGDQVFPTLVQELLPTGLRGLVVGGMLAALMSSLSSLFNSSASLFTLDIYKKLKPKSTERQLVNVGRIATVVIVGLGLMWIPVMSRLAEDKGLYNYLQSAQAYLAPPITAVFLLGLFLSPDHQRGRDCGVVGRVYAGARKVDVKLLLRHAERRRSETRLVDLALLILISCIHQVCCLGWWSRSCSWFHS